MCWEQTRWRHEANKTTEWVRSTIIGADRAALSVRDVWVLAVRRVFADHLVAHDVPAVTHADSAGFWFPYILVIVQLSF